MSSATRILGGRRVVDAITALSVAVAYVDEYIKMCLTIGFIRITPRLRCDSDVT